MDSTHIVKKALKTTFPVFLGYFPIGIAFSFLASQAGIPWYVTLSMSLFIYSGATQFLVVSLIVAPVSLIEIILATLALNVRHIFYGTTLLQKYNNTSWRKPYLIFGLTDETYALVSNIENNFSEQNGKYYFIITLLNQSYWVAGTLLGSLLGGLLELKIKGLEFALIALFVVLTIEQYYKRKNIIQIIFALVVGLLSILFIPKNMMLLVSILACSIFAVSYRGNKNV